MYPLLLANYIISHYVYQTLSVAERFIAPISEPSILPPILEPNFIPLEKAEFGFTQQTARKILERDDYTCQSELCIFEDVLGRPANRDDGFFMNAAHYPDKHQFTGKGFHDPNISHGRCLCLVCHAIEEVQRHDEAGAGLLLRRSGVFNTTYLRENPEVRQRWFSLEEIKAIVSPRTLQ